MARYIVSALKAVATPTGAVLDRIVGPVWMATPSSLLDLVADGSHEFVLDGGSHSLAARRDPAGNIAILVLTIRAAKSSRAACRTGRWKCTAAPK